jgi:hypothetical protein
MTGYDEQGTATREPGGENSGPKVASMMSVKNLDFGTAHEPGGGQDERQFQHAFNGYRMKGNLQLTNDGGKLSTFGPRDPRRLSALA